MLPKIIEPFTAAAANHPPTQVDKHDELVC